MCHAMSQDMSVQAADNDQRPALIPMACKLQASELLATIRVVCLEVCKLQAAQLFAITSFDW